MSILAPVATKNERLLSYIERGQSDNALGLLLEMQDAAAESSEAIPPEAILMASSKGFSDVVDALLDSGADIEAREVAPAFTGRTPLLLGSAGGFPRGVEVLLAPPPPPHRHPRLTGAREAAAGLQPPPSMSAPTVHCSRVDFT